MTLARSPAFPESPAEQGNGARVDGDLKVSGRLLYSADLLGPS